MQSPNSKVTTNGIQVEAAGQLLVGRTFPKENRWMYAYRIRITNVGHKPLRLLRRHWIITDANGERREVRGDGVVGETPRIAPGADYEYRSMCDFPTAWGTMEGSFAFVDDLDTEYQIEVARFFLVESSENAIV